MKHFRRKLQQLFKRITYSLFLLFHGKISSSIKTDDEKSIQVEELKVKNLKYSIYFCQNCRLYTDRIHDTAIISKNNNIIEGPSFQYRQNKNADISLNSVFEKGTPRIKKQLKGNLFSLLTGGGGNFNYWHWLFDVLPRIYILENSQNFNSKINFYLFPSLERKFQNETLDILNIAKEKRLSSKNVRHVYAEKIIVTSHPYAIENKPLSDSLKMPVWIFEFLRNKFLKNDKNLAKNDLPKKIYINRKDSLVPRYIINENEVSNCLIENGFTSITLSDLSFIEQVQLFKNADYIAGLHGAGFANIIFCKPDTKILELKPISAGEVIKNLANNNNLIYNDISVKGKTINFNNQAGDIEIDISLLRSIINKD